MRRLINTFFVVITLSISVPLSAQDGRIGAAVAENMAKNFFLDLNRFTSDAKLHGGRSYYYSDTRNSVLSRCSDKTIINTDFKIISGGDRTESVYLTSYLDDIEKVALEKTIIYKLIKTDGIIEEDGDDFLVCHISVVDHDGIEYYSCTARVGFKGGKIISIKYQDFKLPPPPRKAVIHDPFIDFGLGPKFPPDNLGVSINIGIGGLSESWIINRMRLGFEGVFYEDDINIHYPSVSDGNPSTMSYSTILDGWSILFVPGYMIFPWKYDDYDDYDLNFYFNLGIGAAFYDYWTEKTSQSDVTRHNRASFVLKPSVRIDFPGMGGDDVFFGVDLGYYYSRPSSSIQGLSIQFQFKLIL